MHCDWRPQTRPIAPPAASQWASRRPGASGIHDPKTMQWRVWFGVASRRGYNRACTVTYAYAGLGRTVAHACTTWAVNATGLLLGSFCAAAFVGQDEKEHTKDPSPSGVVPINPIIGRGQHLGEFPVKKKIHARSHTVAHIVNARLPTLTPHPSAQL